MPHEPFGHSMIHQPYIIRRRLTEAHELAALGYHLVPCEPGGKRPLIAWKNAQSDPESIDEWFRMFGTHLNLAIHTGRSGVVVLDADGPAADAWVARHFPNSPMRARTPRGGAHYYFQAASTPPLPSQNLFDLRLDVRAGNSIVIVAPSWSARHRRRWSWLDKPVSPAKLPVIDSILIRKPLPPSPSLGPTSDGPSSVGPIHDVTRWILAVESIQGAYGSNACFKVACRLVDAGMPWDEAWRWLCHWNASGKAIPPWSEVELRHKLEDAFARFNIEGVPHESSRSRGSARHAQTRGP